MERYGQDIEYDMSSIIKRHDGPYTLYLEAMNEIEKRDKEIAKLKADLSKPPQERTYCKGCSLPRLTALLNDNERAKKVANTTNAGDLQIDFFGYRGKAINDYRAMLKEEIK